MFLRQYFDHESYTYTYLIADAQQQVAVLIDPVKDKAQWYIQLLNELNFTLIGVLDSHTHADHISASGQLRELTSCKTYLGFEALSDCVDDSFSDGDVIWVGDIAINTIHTPGHTSDSYCFHVHDQQQDYLFTGDTLLIRGSGRTDFQQGNAIAQYHSIFDKLFAFPDNTIVYPAHDYQGRMLSTLAEEKQFNPRLQVTSADEYAAIMGALNLPSPKLMDVAVPANQACGKVI